MEIRPRILRPGLHLVEKCGKMMQRNTTAMKTSEKLFGFLDAFVDGIWHRILGDIEHAQVLDIHPHVLARDGWLLTVTYWLVLCLYDVYVYIYREREIDVCVYIYIVISPTGFCCLDDLPSG